MIAAIAAAVIVILLAAIPAVGQPKMTVIDKGTADRDGGGGPVSYTVSVGDIVPPGMFLAFDSSTFGDAALGVSTSTQYYYAGIANGSVHVWRIVRDLKTGGFVERERLPILLPLASDGTTALLVRPLAAKAFSLRLKRNADNSLTVTVVK